MICDFPRCDLARTGCPCPDFSVGVTGKAQACGALAAENAALCAEVRHWHDMASQRAREAYDAEAERDRLREAVETALQGYEVSGNRTVLLDRLNAALTAPSRPDTPPTDNKEPPQ